MAARNWIAGVIPNDAPEPAVDDEPEPFGPCSGCGRDLWWTGQAPSMDGNAWICSECDAARSFDALDL